MKKHKNGWRDDSTIVINNDNFYEEIKYAGRINFSDDETSIKSITPNGYLRFTKNEEKVNVESDKNGLLTYSVSLGKHPLALDSNARKLITDAIKEWIAWGIDGQERMERIYKKSGTHGLLTELDNLKNDQIRLMYFDKLLKSDSLSSADRVILIKKIGSSIGSDGDKRDLLRRFTPDELKDSTAISAYLQAIENFGDDNEKAEALKSFLVLPLANELFPRVLHSINKVGGDDEKTNLLRTIIDKRNLDDVQADLILETIHHINSEEQKKDLFARLIDNNFPSNRFDTLLQVIGSMGDDMGKENLYRKLISGHIANEEQWSSLINITGKLNSDEDKSNMMLEISQKMPINGNLKSIYLKAAKTIRDDMQYGRAVRAVE